MLSILLRVVILDLLEVVFEGGVQDLPLVWQLVDVLDQVIKELAIDIHNSLI